MREFIILAGGYRLSTQNASAIRALGLAQLFSYLGYRVIVMGKFDATHGIARAKEGLLVDGVICRDIQEPIAGRSCGSYVDDAESLMQVVDEVGSHRVLAILCYNYPARGAWSMIRQARKRGIAPVLDCTEWYGWEGKKILRNLWRMAGVEVRMRVLTRFAGNVICASEWFRARVPNQHTILLPFVLDTSLPKWHRAATPDPARTMHFVYSGSPGLGMHKDRLPVMIAALAQVAEEGHQFRITVAGMTRQQYLDTMSGHQLEVELLGDRLRFLGRIPHAESLALLRSADFSVFFRIPNRVSNTGFATKFVEAATLGVPVISNPTSDISRYLHDGENGILARSIKQEDIKDALRRAITLTTDERSLMVARWRAANPFDFRLWLDDASAFLENLRGINV